MLRSFSYAAQSALQRAIQRRPDSAEALGPWVALWENAASAGFLQAYLEALAARPEILPAPAEARTLLSALLLEKAFYELLYELNNRPTWLQIPLQGLLKLLHSVSDPTAPGAY